MNSLSKNKINLHKGVKILNLLFLVSIVCYGLGLTLIGAYYSYPNAEDLSVSIEARKEMGFFISVIQTMVSYDGRYFTNILHAINPLVFNSFGGYKWTVAAMVFGLIFSIFFLLRTLNFKLYNSLIFSVLSVIAVVALVPSAPHFLYWMISGFVYLVPWIFLFFTLAFSLKYFKAQSSIYKNIWFVLAIISLFSGIGLNEMFLPVYFILLIIGSFYSYKKSKLLDFLPFLVVGISALYLFITSPGISNRLTSFTENRDFSYFTFVFQTCTKHILYSFYIWVFQNLIFIPFLLIIIIHTPKWVFSKLKNISLIYLILAIVIIVSMLIPYYYAMGIYYYYPKRIFSGWLPGFTFLSILFFYFVFSKNQFLSKKLIDFKKNKLLSPVLLGIMLCSLIFSNNNIKAIYNDFSSGALKNYKLQLENRYETIQLAAEANEMFKIAVVDSLKKPPKSIYHGPDIKANRFPAWWNIAYEDYFYLEEIKLKSDTTPFFIQIHYENFLNE